MRPSRFAIIGMLSAIACAGAPKPKVFGTAPNLTPSVQILGNDRVPLHLRIDQPQSSYVSAFLVVPGQGTQMLYPADSSGSTLLPAGSQDIATAFATRRAGNDTSRLLRRSPRPQSPDGSAGIPPGSGGDGRDNRGGAGMQESFVLVYTSTDSLAFKSLNDHVIGVSLPGYNDEAFNTVTKLIRTAATGNGPWSAVAVPFRP